MTNKDLYDKLNSCKIATYNLFDNNIQTWWPLDALNTIYSSCNRNYFTLNKDKHFERAPNFKPQFQNDNKRTLISSSDCFNLLEHSKIEKSFSQYPNLSSLSQFSCHYLLIDKPQLTQNTPRLYSVENGPEFIKQLRQYTFSQIYFLIPNAEYETIYKYHYALLNISLEAILIDYNKQLRSLIYKASRNTTTNDPCYSQVYGNINSCMFGQNINIPKSKNMNTDLLFIKVNILQQILDYFYSNPQRLSIQNLISVTNKTVNDVYKDKKTSQFNIKKCILTPERQKIKRQLLNELKRMLPNTNQH